MKKKQVQKMAGMTLIELLLYIAIVSGFVVSLTYFVLSIDQLAIKSKASAEVNSNVRYINTKISYLLRNADNIISATSSDLTFTTQGSTYHVYAADNVLYLNIDGEDKMLTSSKVEATSLLFEDLTPAGPRSSIRITFEIKHKNPDNNNILNVTQSSNFAVTLRQ